MVIALLTIVLLAIASRLTNVAECTPIVGIAIGRICTVGHIECERHLIVVVQRESGRSHCRGLGAIDIKRLHRFAVLEGFDTDFLNAAWQRELGERTAFLERLIANACYGIGKIHGGQAATLLEGCIVDVGHGGWHSNSSQAAAMHESRLADTDNGVARALGIGDLGRNDKATTHVRSIALGVVHARHLALILRKDIEIKNSSVGHRCLEIIGHRLKGGEEDQEQCE